MNEDAERTRNDATRTAGRSRDTTPGGGVPEPADGPDAEGAAARAEDTGTVSPEAEEERAAEAELRDDLDHLQSEFDALHDRHLRLAADFENYRRRAESEMAESWIRAQADLVRRLLDPLDDLERVTALDPAATSVEAVLEGVELVRRKLVRALLDAGAHLLEPEGDRFDPNTMEAVMRVPTDDEEVDDTVDQVFQKGWTFKGHLVRPARVSVRKHD